MKNKGFSLLELSIVLVIIGLIAGGVVVGSSMIRAAELRAVVTEHSQFKTATHTFRDKYLGLPGDIKNATAFWGDDATNCADAAVTDGTPGTCNGDGDGILETNAAASSPGEPWAYWQQLELAGLVNGTFSGLSGSGGVNHSILGENIPEAKLSGAGWTMQTWNNTGSASAFINYYENHFAFGTSGGTSHATSGAVLTPQEAWSLDKKMDDGKPGQGSMLITNIAVCTDAADNLDYAADYDLAIDTVSCAVRIHKNF